MAIDRTEASDLIPDVRRGDVSSGPPAPFAGRPIFVIVGMHHSGGAELARMLQMLGVDMADSDPEDATWERPEITALNDRLLDLIGRPLGGAAHALPFPAGWWGDARVLALKREAQAVLAAALDGRFGWWGFKDLRTTRLLPFWQQVFDEMALAPRYLWVVRDPASSAAAAVAGGLAATPEIAEAMWLIYHADVHKFVGDAASAVIDHRDWQEAPTDLVEDLLERLPLTWRGSHGELLECVRMIVARRPTAPEATAAAHSPLVRTFYDAIRDRERSDASLRQRGSVVQAVDLLRTLVTPYAALIGDGRAPAAPTPPTSRATDDALAEALARAEEAEAATRETEAVLTAEIEARASENSWLQQQFAEAKRLAADHDEVSRRARSEAEAETARVRLELEASIAAQRAIQRKLDEAHAAAERQRRHAKEELEQVRKDLALQKTANEKYLSRIYELKAVRRTDGAVDPAPAG